MTAVKTFPLETADIVSHCLVESGRTESPKEQYRRWRLEAAERQEREGLADEQPLTMEEIVAIIKEVRAERYAEKQKKFDLSLMRTFGSALC